MGFDPVSYIMGKAAGGGGGGGGSEVLIDEFQSQDSGGSFNLQKTITIESAGNYIVTASGYCNGVEVSLNGTILDNAFDDGGSWVYYFHNTLSLQAGDLLTINIWSSGRSAEYASVIKL